MTHTETQAMCERLEAIQQRVRAATDGPWAYESVSEKANDYRVGLVCPADEDGDVGEQISGNVKDHPHYFTNDTGKFGEWYCEEIAAIDEASHTSDGSPSADASFIAHAREDIPYLLALLTRQQEGLAQRDLLLGEAKSILSLLVSDKTTSTSSQSIWAQCVSLECRIRAALQAET